MCTIKLIIYSTVMVQSTIDDLKVWAVAIYFTELGVVVQIDKNKILLGDFWKRLILKDVMDNGMLVGVVDLVTNNDKLWNVTAVVSTTHNSLRVRE